jgi:hypothetical protein
MDVLRGITRTEGSRGSQGRRYHFEYFSNPSLRPGMKQKEWPRWRQSGRAARVVETSN